MKIIQKKYKDQICEIKVDDEWYDKIILFPISINFNRNKLRVIIVTEEQPIFLHRFLMGNPNFRIGVKDGNWLNCQKDNFFVKDEQAILANKQLWYEKNHSKIIKKSTDWIHANPERFKINQKVYKQSLKAKATRRKWRQLPNVKSGYNNYYRIKRTDPKYRYNYLQNKCKQDGKEFSLSLEQYVNLIHQPCYYSGESLLGEKGRGLDRIDNSKGYTIDNVLPCKGWVNKMRNNILTVEETKIAVKAIMEYRKICYRGDDSDLVKVEKKND